MTFIPGFVYLAGKGSLTLLVVFLICILWSSVWKRESAVVETIGGWSLVLGAFGCLGTLLLFIWYW